MGKYQFSTSITIPSAKLTDCNEGGFNHLKTTPYGGIGGGLTTPATPNALGDGFGRPSLTNWGGRTTPKGLRSGLATIKLAVGGGRNHLHDSLLI